MMKKPFEGFGQACAYAEIESKKQKNELWVVKSFGGGLHYEVITTMEDKTETDKVLAHYKEGLIHK
jgi:hypothetical protein